MTTDACHPEGRQRPSVAGRISFSAVETSTAEGITLGRIYQALSQFTVLTNHLRALVDERMARHLSVTGWQNGVLRVHLGQPAFATRWRFQEPAVRRAMIQRAGLTDLREIRLVMTNLHRPRTDNISRTPSQTLLVAPAEALLEMAASEEHPALRAALQSLGEAAALAQARAHAEE